MIRRFPILFSPRSCKAVSSALKDEISKVAPRDFMMSSSIEPDVVTRMFGIFIWQSCAKRPRSPEVTMLDVNVRKIFVFSRFIFRKTFWASFNSIAWYPRFPNASTISSVVMLGLYLKSFTFFILELEEL